VVAQLFSCEAIAMVASMAHEILADISDENGIHLGSLCVACRECGNISGITV
jgi:hypothetical protein